MAQVKHTVGMNKPKVYSAENFRCQKCLEKGHFTYECTGKRKYVSRTSLLKKRLKTDEEEETTQSLNVVEQEETPSGAKVKGELNKSSNSSEHSDESTSEDSESDSTSSSSSDTSSSSSRSRARSRSSSSSSSSSSSTSSSSGSNPSSSSSSDSLDKNEESS